MTASRLDKLTDSLRASGLDAVALNPGPTLKYLTDLNFHLMERPVVLIAAPGQDPAIILPELLIRSGKLDLSLGNSRMAAGLVAVVVASITKNTLLTILAGVAALLILQFVM